MRNKRTKYNILTQQLTAQVDKEKYKMFRIKVLSEGKTVTELVNEWVDKYLADQPIM